MKEVTGQLGLAAIEHAGGYWDAEYVLKRGHDYPPATGRIEKTYRQLKTGPMTGNALFDDLEKQNWLLPNARRPYTRGEFRSHLEYMIRKKRLHVLHVDAQSGHPFLPGQGTGEEVLSAKSRGIAFKVAYNDGGANGGLIGYRGVCSDRNMVQNVKVKPKPWCSNDGNECRLYCDNGRNGKRPQTPCYESRLLVERPMRIWTGVYHKGAQKGEPIPIDVRKLRKGDIALFTTVLPECKEENRIIFACFRVAKTGADDKGNFVESDGTMDVVLPNDIVRHCRYWDYQSVNIDGSTSWKSGLFRYLEAEAVQRFLSNLVFQLGDAPERDLIVRALGDSVKPKMSGGSGGHYSRSTGEGEEHRALKELVAKRPKLIGLPSKSRAELEHSFLSGDRVDVKFDLPNGTAAVVEVETVCPLPGAHQAVKYRALLEVERSEMLGSGSVQAILVAHRFDAETRHLAKKYEIKLVELKA